MELPEVQNEMKEHSNRSHGNEDAVGRRKELEGQQATKITMRGRRFSTTKRNEQRRRIGRVRDNQAKSQ